MKLQRLFACILLCAATQAMADCSRPIQVPLAATGFSVIVKDQQVSGIYPEVLAEAGKRANCTFVFKPVPRARLEALFETGAADMLLPAPRTARRDQHGIFIPLIQARATVITVNSKLEPVQSLAQLKGLRVAVVRGFDYGEPYQRFLREGAASGQIFVEVDPEHVARLLHAGIADAAVMTPTVLAGAIQGEKRVAGLLERLRIEPVEELDWVETGVYLSRSTLGEADQNELARILAAVAQSQALWTSYKRYYPAHILAASLRPRT
jgi:polar amino acid transport system substrate-binding protein